MPIHIILSDLSYIWQTTTRQIKMKTISKKQKRGTLPIYLWREEKNEKAQEKIEKFSLPTNKKKQNKGAKKINWNN